MVAMNSPKVNIKLESDGIYRAYTQVLIGMVDSDAWDVLEADYHPTVWVPVASSTRKELCVREAKRRVTEIPQHYFQSPTGIGRQVCRSVGDIRR